MATQRDSLGYSKKRTDVYVGSEYLSLSEDATIAPHCFLGKPLSSGGSRVDRKIIIGITMIGAADIGHGVTIYEGAVIGDHCLIGDGARIGANVRIGEYSLIAQNTTINIGAKIGHHTKIMDLCHITGNAVIGDHCFIGMHTVMANDNAMGGESDKPKTGPHIGDKVRIGMGAMILPGVNIGDGALIGAGSVVTKDCEPYGVYMGAPARFVKWIV